VCAGVQPAGSAAVRACGERPDEVDASDVEAEVATVRVVVVADVGARLVAELEEPPDPQAATAAAVASAATAPPQREIAVRTTCRR
jgi:hypothetical protein